MPRKLRCPRANIHVTTSASAACSIVSATCSRCNPQPSAKVGRYSTLTPAPKRLKSGLRRFDSVLCEVEWGRIATKKLILWSLGDWDGGFEAEKDGALSPVGGTGVNAPLLVTQRNLSEGIGRLVISAPQSRSSISALCMMESRVRPGRVSGLSQVPLRT